MHTKTIFSQIINHKLPADVVYQNEDITAFRDINPQAQCHILIIPNKVIPTVNDITEADELIMGKLFTVARQLAKQEGIAHDGYRLIINCNQHGGQEVFHLHMHLLGGEPLGKMLCK